MALIISLKNSTESTLGLNWYLTSNLRLMANCSKVKINKRSLANNENYDFFGFRTQINF
jgi:phosphate-selective porin